MRELKGDSDSAASTLEFCVVVLIARSFIEPTSVQKPTVELQQSKSLR
jgi:hypothetical protein